MPRLARSGAIHPPTRRELQVAEAIIRCGSGKAAAADLGIALGTVREHVSNLIERTGSTTGFMGVLVALGWVRVKP